MDSKDFDEIENDFLQVMTNRCQHVWRPIVERLTPYITADRALKLVICKLCGLLETRGEEEGT